MRTDDLIALLARSDDAAPPHAPRLLMAGGALAGLAVALGALVATIGIRPDIAAAALSRDFVVKMAFVTALAGGALVLSWRVSLPGMTLRPGLAAAGVPVAAIALAALVYLAATPAGSWGATVAGSNWTSCLTFVPIFSIGPMVAIGWTMRHLAPTDPAAAGTVMGFTGGAFGAFAYALHCTDDQAPFVAIWYLIAIALVTLAGRALGPRLLRW